ncbi:MAG: acyl carrier protein [Myxococcaceae bacterium]|nr:acyl carrier protein [Myxococcaceae bacterium]MCA3011663.1 acyl carrier protein [Myxococcaceae bacterium]
MTRDELKAVVEQALSDVAPEVDAGALQPTARLRDQLDLDSMDWLRFFAALEATLGVTVSEADARRLHTLADVVAHLEAAQTRR